MKAQITWAPRQLPNGGWMMQLYILTPPDGNRVQHDVAVVVDTEGDGMVDLDEFFGAVRNAEAAIHRRINGPPAGAQLATEERGFV